MVKEVLHVFWDFAAQVNTGEGKSTTTPTTFLERKPKFLILLSITFPEKGDPCHPRIPF